MALSVAQGLITVPAATGTQVTTIGFQAKAIFFWSDGGTASGDAAEAGSQIGFTTGTATSNQCSGFLAGANNATTTGTFFGHDVATTTGLAVTIKSSSGANLAQGAVSAWTSTTFTINWTTVTSGTIVHFLALGGTDITNVASGLGQASLTTTGNQSITGPGFTPDFVFFIAASSALPGGAQSVGFGAATSSTSRFAMSASATTAITKATSSLASRMQDTTKCIELLTGGGSTTVLAAADLVSMDATGFTLNWTTAPAAASVYNWLAIKGANLDVGTFTKNANTTDTTVTVNAGSPMPPSAYMMLGAAGTGNTAQSTGVRFGIGGTNGTNADSICTEYKNGVINTQARKFSDAGGGANHVYHQRALPSSTTVAGADEVLFNHSSFTSSGFVLSYVTNGTTTQYIFPYITFSPTLVTPSAPTTTAADTVTSTSVNANWTAGTVDSTHGPATTYLLDVSTSSGFGSFVGVYNSLDVGNVLTAAVTGLSGGTTYWYRVRAQNSAGTSASSNATSQATTTSGLPPGLGPVVGMSQTMDLSSMMR